MPAERRASSRSDLGSKCKTAPVSLPEPPSFEPPAATSPLPPPPPPLPGTAPAGYVQYRTRPGQKPLRGLSKAVLILYGAVTVASVVLAVAFRHRWSVVDDILASGTFTSADQDAIATTDQQVAGAAALVLALLIAAGILTAVWSRRAARNAESAGVRGVSVGMATGGWFIPIGSWWLGFRELQRSVEGVGHESTHIGRWRTAFIVMSLLGVVVRNTSIDTSGDRDAFLSSLNRQFGLGLVSAVLYAVCLYFAVKAIRSIDEALSPTA